MSDGQQKQSSSSPSPASENPGLNPLSQHPGPYPLPPGAYPPVFFGPPPPEGLGNPGENNHPYHMHYPPMMYVYPPPPPPPHQASPYHGASPAQPANGKPKRKQVKMACTNCATACKKCDEGRPCQRCIRSNLTDTCRDGVRKERKRGIKRGPYKRRARGHSDEDSEAGHVPGKSSIVLQRMTSDIVLTLDGPPQFMPPHPQIPEGYFPYFMPPPPGYFQPEGGPNGGPPPQMPFYPYPQLSPFSFPGGAVPLPYPTLPQQFTNPPPEQVPAAKGKKRAKAEGEPTNGAKSRKKAKVNEVNEVDRSVPDTPVAV